MNSRAPKVIISVAVMVSLLIMSFWPAVEGYGYEAVRAVGRSVPSWSSQGWQTLENDDFQLYFMEEDEFYVPYILDDLVYSLGALVEVIPDCAPRKIPVRIHPSVESISAAIGGGHGPTLGAYSMGRIELLSPRAWLVQVEEEVAYELYRLYGPITHELTHLLLDYAVKDYPHWFSEGLAQYWEKKLKGYVWLEEGVNWRDKPFSFDELEKEFEQLPVNKAYQQSLAIVERLYDAHGTVAMRELLIAMGTGADLNEAAQVTLQVDIRAIVDNIGVDK